MSRIPAERGPDFREVTDRLRQRTGVRQRQQLFIEVMLQFVQQRYRAGLTPRRYLIMR